MKSVPRICRVENCGRKVAWTDLCKTHYHRSLKGLSVDDYQIKPRGVIKTCQFSNCQEEHHAKALCYKHYMRDYSGVALDRPSPNLTLFSGLDCLIYKCDNPAGGKTGLCKWHNNWSGKYKFSVVQAIQILNSGYPCDICSESLSVTNINIDHDHSCCPGQQTCGDCVRGLLCRACNRGLGSFKDQVDLVENAIKYLKHGSLKGA